ADRIADLEKSLSRYKSVKIKEDVAELKQLADDLVKFMESFSCQPLIYTGRGSTEEVINRLEWLLTFSDLNEQTKTKKPRKTSKKAEEK
ncbi:MAG: hypothetical protein ACM3PP_01340, partial [Candidatus Saccharibacteria bacterium]